MNRDDLLKCLESLKVDQGTAEKLIVSFEEAYGQMVEGEIRMSHPSLLKLRYLIEEMFGSFEKEDYKKIIASSTYSSPSTQAFIDLNDALVIQIAKARQFLKKD